MAYSSEQLRLFREFGRRVRAARRDRDWTQEELAYKVGVDRTYIGSIERGERNLGIWNINRIALALNETFDGLLPYRPRRRRRK